MARASGVLGLVLTACGGGRAQAPAPATDSVVTDVPPTTNGVVWSAYSMPAPCFEPPGREPPPAPALLVVSDDQVYRGLFCKPADVDFTRFRLLVYRGGWNSERVEIDTVVRDAADLVLVLRRVGCQDFGQSFATVLVPAGPERVRHFVHYDPTPCPGGSGWAY